jgi:hypothetical protein
MPKDKPLIRHCRHCLQPVHRAVYSLDTITLEFVGHWTHTRKVTPAKWRRTSNIVAVEPTGRRFRIVGNSGTNTNESKETENNS